MNAAKQIVLLGVIGALAAGAWFADLDGLLGREPAETQKAGKRKRVLRPVPVIVKPVIFDSDAAVVEAVGTGVALRAVTLFPESAGRVTAVLVRSGQKVKAGAALLKLDDEVEQLAVKLALVALNEARRKIARYEKLGTRGNIARSEIETARSAVQSAELRLSQAALALKRRTLLAPFSGVVGIAAVEPGDRVTTTRAITSLDDRSALRVDFDVPENFVYGVRLGGALTATTWALPGERFKGAIATIGSRIDKDTRTLRVRALIPNRGDRLRPGMAFSIRLPLTGNRFPSVPSAAIQWSRKGAYVWVVRDNKAARVPVSVVKRSDAWVLVDAKLTAKHRVVIEGVQRLRAGRAVTVRDNTAEAKSPDKKSPEKKSGRVNPAAPAARPGQ
ncbi:MAG: efflux RND transporter periplasmic adaptor subunit [Alphaproteobacteria bacterium]|nr:efflux RND transporter periplasmic adaptor subunit [Alphaproteobacteria bacterium]